MKKIILIPSYEPDNNLSKLVEEIAHNKEDIFDMVIVDDGSGSLYKNIFDLVKKYAYVISYESNKGKGYALKKGLEYIKNKYTEDEYIVVTMDSDGQHTIEDALKLIEHTMNNPNNLVLGKRKRNKNTPLKSRIGNSITRFIYKNLTKIDVYDTQTGLRAFSNNLMDLMLSIEGERYEYEMNVLLKCSSLGIKIDEIEIETIYIDNNSGSHFNPIKDSIRIYKQILKFSMSSLISFVIDYVLYSIFLAIFHNINLSNILARIISATVNYTINRKMVFKSKKKIAKSVIEYVALAVVILILNTLLLNLFVNVFMMNALISKIVVELVLFIFSWLIQKKVIFRLKGEKKNA